MKKQRRIIGFILMAGMLTSLSATRIAAYLADMDSASNPIIVGGNHICIDEEFDPEPIVPGAEITKKVRIKNEGPNDCYVRVRAVFSDSNVGQYASIDLNWSDWVYDSTDEYYYYKSYLEPGETTVCLMTTVTIDEDIPEDMIKDVELIVYAESYQSEGFLDYQDAWADYQVNIK